MKSLSFLFWSIASLLVSAINVFADTTLPNPLGNTKTFPDLIKMVLDNVVTPIGGVVAVFFIIYSGFLFVTAGANETKRGDAKKALLYAVIGTAILVGAQALSALITTTINSLK
jgi:type IV secretory pathway VirB2 component (pilin)